MGALKIILYIVGTGILLFVLFLAYFTVVKYKPDDRQVMVDKPNPVAMNRDTLTFLIWNIGYCGLGKDMSFFYDGGERVRTSRDNTIENLYGITAELKKYGDSDFILLQEVDKSSKRSYHIDQFKAIEDQLNEMTGYFAVNYFVKFVPVPFTRPLGRVKSGMATFTDHSPVKVVRYGFPGSYSWPKNVFMLDRCFMASRYRLKNKAELIVVNTHNSAYDNGKLKEQEMRYLKKFLLNEYHKGHYVIVGGDWNQYPPGMDKLPEADRYVMDQVAMIQDSFMPDGWSWVYDPRSPTNRALNKPFRDTTQTHIIDFYLVSPNVKALEVETIDLKFKYSDHHPVVARFKLQ